MALAERGDGTAGRPPWSVCGGTRTDTAYAGIGLNKRKFRMGTLVSELMCRLGQARLGTCNRRNQKETPSRHLL